MAPQKPRKIYGGAFSCLSLRLSIPFLVFLSGGCFYSGMLYGGQPLELVPILKPPIQIAGRAGGELPERRQVAEVHSSELLAQPHGKSGEGFVSDIPYQVLSWAPRTILYPNFAPPEKCSEIVSLARKHLAPSGLALREGETAQGTKDIRTRGQVEYGQPTSHGGGWGVLRSSGTFLSSSDNPEGALAWVEQKMAKVTMLPVAHGEAYNVLRYEVGQKYNSHYDTFNPKEYGPQSSQRGFQNMNIGYDFKDCIGLKVKPRMGDALLFWSMYPNGTLDQTALHGSCPVIKGEKFVATKWIRSHPQR